MIENKAIEIRMDLYKSFLKRIYWFNPNQCPKYARQLVLQLTKREFHNRVRNETAKINN